MVDEAEWLGLIALGQATQALLDPAATHSLTPDTVDYFIILTLPMGLGLGKLSEKLAVKK